MPFYLKWRLIQLLFRLVMPIVRSRWLSPSTQPDSKRRPSQRYLHYSRVFLPKSPSPSVPPPLVVDVHGGAFVVNTPIVDDPVSRYLADHGQCMVISIDYRKAPQNPFPAGYKDVVEQIAVLLADTTLQFDRSKVILFGSSAGGNLVLAAAQDERLRGRIAGVIGLYPVTDSTVQFQAKMDARPDASIPDLLSSSYEVVQKMYFVPLDKAKTSDVRASPGLFERRTDLPDRIYLIGAEHDLLCKEAKDMAERLAGEAERIPEESGWQAAGIKWELARGQSHGYDIFGPSGESKESKRARSAAKDALYESMAKWIRDTAAK